MKNHYFMDGQKCTLREYARVNQIPEYSLRHWVRRHPDLCGAGWWQREGHPRRLVIDTAFRFSQEKSAAGNPYFLHADYQRALAACRWDGSQDNRQKFRAVAAALRAEKLHSMPIFRE